MKTFLSLILLSLLVSCGGKEEPNDLLLNVRGVINKTPAEVEAELGAPDSTYILRVVNQEIFCQRYSEYNIEIQYPAGRSTDVVIYGPHGLPFTQSALKAFGLDYSKQHPSQVEKDAVMRWYNFDEFLAISFYNVRKDIDTGRINYTIYFKSKFEGV